MNEFLESEAARNQSLQQTTKRLGKGALNARSSLRLHWPEYLMEAGELVIFLFCICAVTTLFQHPASPVRHAIVSGTIRRALIGAALGATLVTIIMTPWGKQSGGHLNPAITLAFFRLGNVAPWDALFYVVAQFSGALAGVAIAACVLRGRPADLAVRYGATMPGVYGNTITFIAELVISLILMLAILVVSNRDKL